MKMNYISDTLGFEGLKLTPYVRFHESDDFGRYELIEDEGSLKLVCDSELYLDEITISESENGFLAIRSFKNKTNEVQRLRELGLSIDGISFGKPSKRDYFYHTENPRIYEQMTFPVDYNRTANDASNSEFDVEAGNKWADPGVISERIGASPYQPFPAIIISNYDTNSGLVHGTLSQRVFFHNYLVSHSERGVKLEVFSSFKSVRFREVKPKETLVDEWYLGNTAKAHDIEKIFAKYSAELRKRLSKNYGATSINRDNVVWGSWNDGIFRDVSEDMLLREARALKENFPTLRWLQLDDGYSNSQKIAHGLAVPYEGDEGIDKNKFPNGLRHFTDELRKIGLRPAIWIGGCCPCDMKLAKEKPEWFCDFSERFKSTKALDVSLKDVQDYAKFAFDKLCVEYGFDAVKHDFWSYPFESSGDYLREKYASGYEHRSSWLQEIRKRIPADGYLQTGCDIVMGNPFLGEYFTNYRYGIDIGVGSWENIRTNFLWGVACFATHTGDLFVPNSDSIGLFPGLNDTDATFCINYIIITRSMVEIAGRFSEISKSNPRFKMLKKAVACPNNGDDVYLGRYDYRKAGRNTPDVIFIKTPHFSTEKGEHLPVRTLALFNIENAPKEISFKLSELDLEKGDYVLTDVWSGEQISISDEYSVTLKAHESRLFSLNKKTELEIFDANFKLGALKREDDELSFSVYYACDAEITLSKTPKLITLDGEELEFSTNKGVVSFKITAPGKIRIRGV